jgi:hypothetical protein
MLCEAVIPVLLPQRTGIFFEDDVWTKTNQPQSRWPLRPGKQENRQRSKNAPLSNS